MYKVRDVFRCKPGKAKELVARLQKTIASTEREDGFRNSQILVDLVADYWTVVWEAEFDSLSDFEQHMTHYGSRPEVQEAMTGYTELVDSGHREIWRVVR